MITRALEVPALRGRDFILKLSTDPRLDPLQIPNSFEGAQMTARKRKATREPLLNTVARKLGHAAGTLTRATHELTENLAALPGTASARVHKAASAAAPAERSRTRAARTHRMKGRVAGAKKRKSLRDVSSRRRPAA
jgi:hypothetical protein